MSNFEKTKLLFRSSIKKVLQTNAGYTISEAALPAYAHANPLIEKLFWDRLRHAYKYITGSGARRVLDFGCGTGVLSYALAGAQINVTAVDLEFSPLKLLRPYIQYPGNISFKEGDLLNMGFPENSFDVIVALDVLEHINNLEEYILEFKRLLKPDGVIVVSGPTENWLYKLGRKIAGKKFTGDYHVNNISNIKRTFHDYMPVKSFKKLYWPFILFELFVAKKVN